MKVTIQKKFNSYICTLLSLMFVDCDFNIPIDEDKNTALMIFILANDWDTFDFLMKHRKDLDLTKENKNGESATSLFMKNKKTNLYYYPIDYRTFNLDYDDPTNGNNILMFSVMTRPDFIPNILSKRPDLINEINNKGENALMIACKANNYDSVSSLLNYSIPINNQDELGNTALHYAIGCKNPIIVQELIQKGINDQLKNNEGKTANDLAMELGDKNILKALKNQLTSEDIKNIKNNDQSKASNDIDVYLYPCTTIIEYVGINLTEEMIKTEKATYKAMVKELSLGAEINRYVEQMMFF